MHGDEMVSFLKKMLKAVNAGNIPTVGSITDTFNERILDSCVDHFNEDMKGLMLPKESIVLRDIYKHRYTEQDIATTKMHLVEAKRFINEC